MYIIVHSDDSGPRTSLIDLPREAAEAVCAALHAQAQTALAARCPWLDLPLSRRAERVLRDAGLTTIGALVACTRTQVRAIPGAGPMVRRELVATCATVGVALLGWRD